MIPLFLCSGIVLSVHMVMSKVLDFGLSELAGSQSPNLQQSILPIKLSGGLRKSCLSS